MDAKNSNINKCFYKTFKKKVLSGESNPEEDRRKEREGSSTTSNNATAEDEVVQQASTTNYISEVIEYLKTLQLKISEIYNLRNDTRSIQMKSDK